MSNNDQTKLVCPNCGAEFEIAEHEHNCKNVTVIGADSGLGTIYMKLKERQEKLKSAGIDTSKYFSMTTPDGTEHLMKYEGSTPVAVTKDDPVMKAILEAGTVPNRDLFRRWVMAQVFRGLSYNGYRGKGFTDWVHSHGYNYTWKMVMEEMRVQAKLIRKDSENFRARNRWFNSDVIISMMNDYIDNLRKEIKDKKVRHCKGVPYIRINRKDIFLSDVEKKIISPLRGIIMDVEMHKNSADRVYNCLCGFCNIMEKLGFDTAQSSAWMDAYKGAGAYFTMKNMILFHGCKFYNDGKWMDKKESLKYLEQKAEEYKGEGWRLFGLMKKFISDNKIDIAAKRREWAEAKRG